ncbi:HlyD family secretion protein [Komagataeibacter rhaeticus]|nr:HlyD family secretion protein [Komagataeibacter rhaeticus]
MARLATLEATLSERMFGVEDTASLDDTRDKIEQETAERLRAEAAIRQLTLTAPFAGMLVDVPPEIHVGDTLKQHDYIGSIITEDHAAIEAYVHETDISFIQPGAKASFMANSPGAKRITGHVRSISVASVPDIDALEQASLYGGHIKAHRDETSHRIVPEEAVYQVIILPDGPLPPVRQRIREWSAYTPPPPVLCSGPIARLSRSLWEKLACSSNTQDLAGCRSEAEPFHPCERRRAIASRNSAKTVSAGMLDPLSSPSRIASRRVIEIAAIRIAPAHPFAQRLAHHLAG